MTAKTQDLEETRAVTVTVAEAREEIEMMMTTVALFTVPRASETGILEATKETKTTASEDAGRRPGPVLMTGIEIEMTDTVLPTVLPGAMIAGIDAATATVTIEEEGTETTATAARVVVITETAETTAEEMTVIETHEMPALVLVAGEPI